MKRTNKIRKENIDESDDFPFKCRKCGTILPEPVLEKIAPGYSELITICPGCKTEYYD